MNSILFFTCLSPVFPAPFAEEAIFLNSILKFPGQKSVDMGWKDSPMGRVVGLHAAYPILIASLTYIHIRLPAVLLSITDMN